MQQKVKVREKLIIHILDEDGNIVKTQEFKPPSGPIERIASKLGILKRHNTVHASGLHVMAKRWVGVTQDPVNWVAARRSNGGDYTTGQWHFRSATATVIGSGLVTLKNDTQTFGGGASARYDMIGTAYDNADYGGYGAPGLVSYIDGVEVDLTNTGDSLMVEIEYDFNSA